MFISSDKTVLFVCIADLERRRNYYKPNSEGVSFAIITVVTAMIAAVITVENSA